MSSPTAYNWNQGDAEARLRGLWSEGYSASQIAKIMGGVTRSAVLGKVRRLGLPRRFVASKKKPPKARGSRSFVGPTTPRKPPRAPTVPPAAPSMRRVSLMDLMPADCRFPVGDPSEKGFFFCGANRTPASSYCAHHHALCYAAPPANRGGNIEQLARAA